MTRIKRHILEQNSQTLANNMRWFFSEHLAHKNELERRGYSCTRSVSDGRWTITKTITTTETL